MQFEAHGIVAVYGGVHYVVAVLQKTPYEIWKSTHSPTLIHPTPPLLFSDEWWRMTGDSHRNVCRCGGTRGRTRGWIGREDG
jgi:hypothetical protein